MLRVFLIVEEAFDVVGCQLRLFTDLSSVYGYHHQQIEHNLVTLLQTEERAERDCRLGGNGLIWLWSSSPPFFQSHRIEREQVAHCHLLLLSHKFVDPA